jgi:hypothetical protein
LVVPITCSKNRRAALRSHRGGHEHLDALAELVDGAVDVAPLPSDLDVGLIHLPAVSDTMPARPGGAGQRRRESLHPAIVADVIALAPRS